MIEAVFFDLDDTLFPQSAWLAGAWDAVVAARPPGTPRTALIDALDEIAAEGTDRGRIIDRALERVGLLTCVAPLVEAFRRHRPATLLPYAGVSEALRELGRLVPLALVTDGDPPTQEAKLDALGLTSMFQTVVVSDRFGRRQRKPCPTPFLAAAVTLGVMPETCVHVGDRPDKDVAGAVAAGLAGAVRVRTGEYAAVPDPPDCLASTADVPGAVAWLLSALGGCDGGGNGARGNGVRLDHHNFASVLPPFTGS